MLAYRLLLSFLTLSVCVLLAVPSAHAQRRHYTAARSPAAGGGGVYPQFRGPGNVSIRWLSEQMPLKVYVAPGTSLDSLIDPALGAPYTSVDNRDHWPDLVASVVQNPDQLHSLSTAQGYTPDQLQAAVQGINSWKNFGGGLFSYEFTEDATDADIYVFWTNHFVNKMGLGLFENDIRGYTAKRSFPLRAIQQGKLADFKPVVTLLRTTESSGSPMPFTKMKASAAHEFGHALGIEGHSTNPNDLMSVYYGHGAISGNDAATIRYLYHTSPDYIP